MDQISRSTRRLAIIAAVTTLVSAPALAASAHDGTGHGCRNRCGRHGQVLEPVEAAGHRRDRTQLPLGLSRPRA